MSVHAAIAQFTPELESDANLATLRAFVAQAAAQGARILVAPEYSSGFAAKPGEWMRQIAQPLDGPFVRAVADLAREHRVSIILGILESGNERPFNTVIAIDDRGALRGAYRKVHLYQAFGADEGRWLARGDADAPAVVAELSGVRVGVQTCYDVRFPESSRRLVDAGAQVLAVPAEWVAGPLKEFHWRTLVQARAIENTCYVLAADQAPPVSVGGSVIVDPRGVERAGLGVETGIAVAELDVQLLERVREENPALTLRRYAIASTSVTVEE